MITANPDVYGKHARASAIADYLELLALRDVRLSRADVADFLHDNNWSIPAEENYVGGIFTQAEDDEGSKEVATRIVRLLNERADVLGDRYPFDMDTAGRLKFQTENSASDSYLLLLAITTAHAHGVSTQADPTELFPEVVKRAYNNRGWSASNLGSNASRRMSFEDALSAMGMDLQLPVNPTGTILSKSAKDAGVDCVSHYPWCGTRLGRWIAVTQVTCANSDEWRKKLFDAQPHPWQSLLGEVVMPKIVLAIPHHAEPRHRVFLFSQANGERFLLDRLSFVPHLPLLDKHERDVLDRVLSTEVESP
jgi:hypothetical protein